MTESPSRVPLQELVGQRLGDYVVRRILGHGSMGVVFEAVHEKLGRRVALKVLPPGLGATEKAIQRFLREAQAVAQLSHENIVPIFEIGTVGAMHFYAMQFLDGEPLDQVLKRGPLHAKAAARLICTAARAIHFAHQRGIIHRDIKPANMIRLRDADGDGVEDDDQERKVVLTDFGLARQEQGSSITDSGAMVGTPLYMSPEQIRAHRGGVGRGTDVYSLGATLYEMVAGRPPFHGESTQEILQKILDEEPRPPRVFASHLPEDLEVVILKALEKEPRRRYASALELAQDLERFLEGEPILAHRTTVVGRSWRRVRKHKTIAILSAVVAVISLAFAFAMKTSVESSANREFRVAREAGDAALGEGNHLGALQKYEEALARRDDDDARLGRARALCAIAKDWERSNAAGEGETLPQLATRFNGGFEGVYALARADVDLVARHRPEDPLALFYRGYLRWRSKDPLEQSAGVDDLIQAGKKSEHDWRTQIEFASFRLGLTGNPRFAPDMKGELLQQALTNVSDALKLMHASVDGSAIAPTGLFLKELAHAHRLRADIYQSLYETVGNARLYVDLCLDDCGKALGYDPRESRAERLREWAQQQIAAAEAAHPAPGPAPTSAATPDAANLASNLLKVFGTPESSEKSKFLAELLQKGGELLATGWQQTDGIRGDLMDQFVNPYLTGTVDKSARSEAAREAQLARDALQQALERGEVKPEDRRTARDHLANAVAKNPRSPQFLFELAVVEQDLGELESARTHLEKATGIATSNPLFFHQLALVCEQLKLPADALKHERRTVELAPASPEFVAKKAALAIAAAQAATDGERARFAAEAKESVSELEALAPGSDQLTTLRQGLAALEGRSE